MRREMIDLTNWTQIHDGIYKYDISEKLHCEIIVMYKKPGMKILDSTADLYLVGDITNVETGNKEGFERSCFVLRKSVRECMRAAANIKIKDKESIKI